MSDVLRPVPFSTLLNWLLNEWEKSGSIFAYPQSSFFKKSTAHTTTLFGEMLETPLGPAAGPHTQMAQNIVVAYLAGGRFFELKTVQKLDQLNIPRPCIYAQDEGYNVEWSQELLLEQSFDEYLKAWFILHLLQGLWTPETRSKGFIFNMSVGYDLRGIQTPKMNAFIDSLIDATQNANFHNYKQSLIDWLKTKQTQQALSRLTHLSNFDQLLQKVENISPLISNSVTVSTMHGCPPQEIEAICSYLLTEKKLNTYVKLNPTLLGFSNVRHILDQLGYRYMELDPASFEHDLQFDQAVPMIKRLQQRAKEQGRAFGIKLSNTLGMKNAGQALPGDEMYMSGRALFPLTINLAAQLAATFEGKLNISYSGGASQYNVQQLLRCGLFPVTLVTDLLKPGGYARLYQMVETIEQKDWPQWLASSQLNVEYLKQLANQALTDRYYSKERRQIESIKINKPLPTFDCYLSPCREACPIHQDVAEYIRLVEEQRYLDAFRVIIKTNPLPHITGYICDHQCQYHCTRWDYEDPVYIREMKKVAAENAWQEFLEKEGPTLRPEKQNGINVAVIGAGPAGLAAAYFLARNGFSVTVFEKETQAGGVVQHGIPDFRLPQYAIERDVELIKRHGVQFKFGVSDVSVSALKKEGFKYVFIAIGAGKSRTLPLQPADGPVFDVLNFLRDFKAGKSIKLGKKVAVVGGGNSAMDAARAAKRIPGVKQVMIVYRRTRAYMPADLEEIEEALNDGVIFKELLLPVGFADGKLRCQKMQLAEKDSDGRRQVKPIPGAFEDLSIDALIPAIGEEVDETFLRQNGIVLTKEQKTKTLLETNVENVFIGGDALRGPSTVVESMADGKQVAEIIMLKEGIQPVAQIQTNTLIDYDRLLNDLAERKGHVKPLQMRPTEEAARCLSCNFICDKCVEVCPNRAYLPIVISNGRFKNRAQILHIDDWCNECGNCVTFCPYQGKPYQDKITFFSSLEDFENSENEGFVRLKNNEDFTFKARFQKQTGLLKFNAKGEVVASDFGSTSFEMEGFLLMLKEIILTHSYLLSF